MPVENVGPDLLFVSRAIMLRDDDAIAGGKAKGDRQKEKRKTPRRAYGGERSLARKVANYDGVHRVVQLLQKRPCQHGQGKPDNMLPGSSLRHEFHLHKITADPKYPAQTAVPFYLQLHLFTSFRIFPACRGHGLPAFLPGSVQNRICQSFRQYAPDWRSRE